MMFSQSSNRDLDAWAALGNKGWDWETLGPYYRKFETYCPPSDELHKAMHSEYIDPELHGSQGPIKTSFCESMSGWLEEVWFETAKQAGYPVHTDARKGTSIGAFNQLMAIDPETKERSYSASGFFKPNRDRPNLHVLTNAMANRIAFAEPDEDGTFNAIGVSFSSGGSEFFAKTKREVIVCAGAIKSPQILELSGIGGKSLLDKLGIQLLESFT